ncbi:uncharacterized protein [Dermacentor albipictus]|uniref:uncharacterized protein n=1 Tax=Dermacentor albipictus TaxID=60249 RepID=UPI0038FCCEC7
MPPKAGRKAGFHKTRSQLSHKGRRKGSSKETAKRGSVGKGGGKSPPDPQPTGAGPSSISGSTKPPMPVTDMPTKTDVSMKRGSTQVSLKSKHHRSSASHTSVGGTRKQSAHQRLKAMRRRVEDEFSSQERKRIWDRCGKVATTVCAAVLVLGVLVTLGAMAYFMLASHGDGKGASAMRGFALMASLRDACYTDDCRMAVDRMNGSVDAAANPCEDLYQYACGHWITLDSDGNPLTYEQAVRHQYVEVLHGNLTSGTLTGGLCRSDKAQGKMSCVYASCVAFYTTRSSTLVQLLAAANMEADRWMDVKSFEALFTLMVRTIVKTHLPSVLSIIWRDVSTAVVETGACLSCSSTDKNFTRYLLHQAVSIKVVDRDSVQRLTANVVSLDNSLRRLHQAPGGALAKAVDTGVFDEIDKETWQLALAGAGSVSRPGDVQLVSSNSKGIAKAVAQLNSAPLEAAKLYTLLAPLAPYVELERYEAQQRGSMKPFKARSMCVENVAYLFTVPFDTMVTTMLSMGKAAVDFNNMVNDLRLAGVNDLHVGVGFELDKKALETVSVSGHEASGSHDNSSAEKYGNDFLANLILYQRSGARHFQTADFRSDGPHKGGFMPTSYFLPDFYYGGATEETLNSGTLGALVAAMLFRASLPKPASEQSSYVSCFAKYSQQSLKLAVNGSDWMRHTRAHWALEVSFKVTRQSAEGRHHKELDALHYLRFARTYCGEQEKHRMPLKFAVRSSANFNRTFECAYPYPPMAC